MLLLALLISSAGPLAESRAQTEPVRESSRLDRLHERTDLPRETVARLLELRALSRSERQAVSPTGGRASGSRAKASQIYVKLKEKHRRYSGGWENDFRFVYSYDNGRLRERARDAWVNGRWAEDERRLYERYLSSGALDSTRTEEKLYSGWQNKFRVDRAYDDRGNRTLYLSQEYDPETGWANRLKNEDRYDAENRRVERYNYEGSGSGWVEDTRTDYTYNGPDGQISEKVTEARRVRDGVVYWENLFRFTYTYDLSGRVSGEQGYTWNASESRWTPFYRYVDYVYNSADRPTEYVEEWYDTQAQQWDRFQRYQITYDDGGNETYWLNEEWDGEGWVPFQDVSTTYGYVALPVELAGFEARPAGESVRLNWGTLSETNNAGFYVQRRPAGSGRFTDLGFIEGAGTTQEPKRYRFTDPSPGPAGTTVAYRLKQVDHDGTATVTDPVVVAMPVERVSMHGVSPQPVRSQATITFLLPQSQHVRLDVVDLLGRRVRIAERRSFPAGRHTVSVDATSLAAGTYFVRLTTKTDVHTRRMVRVR